MKENRDTQESMNIVIVGHVDHGKSTIIGRMLADTDSLPQGKLEQVKEQCRRNSKPFEYAFLLDALKDERSQGITIDTARVFFKTEKRKYIILDAPGHIEFLKNMVTGAARAEAALLVIDALEGVRENSKRHGYLLSMLGIKQVVVLVNKMDLVDYSEERFQAIVSEYKEFLKELNMEVKTFIPVSGFYGENIAQHSEKLGWYQGLNVLETLDDFSSAEESINEIFRMPVQAVYKFTENKDSRRIIAGTIETGSVSVGDTVVFYPSNKKSKVKSIEYFNGESRQTDYSGSATGFTLEEQIYITRGELACKSNEEKPEITSRIRTKLFWLGQNNLIKGKQYLFKIGNRRVKATIEDIPFILDASNLNNRMDSEVKKHEVAEVILSLDKEIAFDLSSRLSATSRFVLIDDYEIAGGGIIVEALADDNAWIRQGIHKRDEKWMKIGVSGEERSKAYGHAPALIVVTGERGTGRKEFANYLEKRLFLDNRKAYILPINNILYSVDLDIVDKSRNDWKQEHLRRLAEVTNILLDSGLIVIMTLQSASDNELQLIQDCIKNSGIFVIRKESKNESFEEVSDRLFLDLVNQDVFTLGE